MKKQWINFWLLFSPVILLIFIPAGYFAAWKISVFTPFAILTWIYNAIFSPILHFGAIASFVKKGLISKKKAVISSLTYFVLVVLSNLGLALAIYCSPRIVTYNENFNTNNYYAEQLISDAVTGLLWAAICCLIIFGYFMAVSDKKRPKLLKWEAVGVVVATVLMPVLIDFLCTVTEIEAPKYYIITYLYPLFMIAVFSCLLGFAIPQRRGVIKLVAWCLGLVISAIGYVLLSEQAYILRRFIENPEQIPYMMQSMGLLFATHFGLTFGAWFLSFMLKGDAFVEEANRNQL